MRKNKLLFSLGSAFGLICAYMANNPHAYYYLPDFMERFLFGPAAVSYITLSFLILGPYCKLTHGEKCIGLLFDGGPLEWLEYLFLFPGSILGWGLIFLILYRIYIRVKSKSYTSKDKSKLSE